MLGSFALRLLLVHAAMAGVLGAAMVACSDPAASDAGAGSCPMQMPSGCPSWTNDVQPIINARCVACHMPGGAGSSKFDYTTYEGVRKAGTDLAVRVESCAMPPADAAPLTPIERGTLFSWVECDSPSE